MTGLAINYSARPLDKSTCALKRICLDTPRYITAKNSDLLRGVAETWYEQPERFTGNEFGNFLLHKAENITWAAINKPTTLPIEETFRELCSKWREETEYLSSPYEIAMNDSYQQIIGLGEAAVSLILQDLAETYDHWFWALKAITRQNPASDHDAGDVRKIAEAWISWGKQEGYI